MRERIRLIAAERGLPESEIRPVLSKLKHEDVAKFVQRHRLSFDWLLCGRLKGRLRMTRGQMGGPSPIASEAQSAAAGGTRQKAEALRTINPST